LAFILCHRAFPSGSLDRLRVTEAAFRARYDEYQEDGAAKGINFSLEVATECARRMLGAARDPDERGLAAGLLGNALLGLGQRESGTTRLEQAAKAFRDALLEYTRERMPLQWAGTQNNLGLALWTVSVAPAPQGAKPN
jgi:hypothetical protein